MRMDKLTSKFQMALGDAQSLAVGRDHQFIEPVHLMVALLDQQGGTVRHLLGKAGGNINLLRSQLGDTIDRLPRIEGAGGDVHMSNDTVSIPQKPLVVGSVQSLNQLACLQPVELEALCDILEVRLDGMPGHLDTLNIEHDRIGAVLELFEAAYPIAIRV